MKEKIMLLFFIALIQGKSIFSLDLKSAQKIQIDLYSSFPLSLDFKETVTSKLSSKNSVVLKTPGIETFFSFNTKNNILSDFSFYEPSFSIKLKLKECSDYPLLMHFGNLNPGGSYTKAASPAFSSFSSAFTTFSCHTSKLFANSKSSSESNNLYSSFFSYDFNFSDTYKNQTKLKIQTSLFAREDKTTIGNFYLSFSPDKKRNLLMEFSQTLSFYEISNQNQNWFSFADYFPHGLFKSIQNQLSFISPFLKIKSILNLYESRKSFLDWTFSTEETFSINFFTFSSAFFYSSSPFIFTNSGKNVKTLEQLFLNPYFTFFYKNKFKIRSGISIFFDKSINTKGRTEIKGRSAFTLDIKGKNSLFKIETSLKDLYFIKNDNPISFQESIFSGKINFGYLKNPLWSISFNFESNFQEGTRKKIKLQNNFQIKLKNKKAIPLNGTASFTIKNKEENLYISEISIGANSIFSFLNTNFHLSGKIKFSF